MNHSSLSLSKVLSLLICLCIVCSSAKAGFEELSYSGVDGMVPCDISNNGTVVGLYYVGEFGEGNTGVFLYENEVFSLMNGIDENHTVLPFGINDDGIIVGLYSAPRSDGNYPVAFMYEDEAIVELDCPFAETGSGDMEGALGINNEGLIVGFDYYNNPRPQGVYGFLYDSSTSDFQQIQYVEEGEVVAATSANDINDNGIICGTYFDYSNSDYRFRGFLFDGSDYTTIDYPGSDITATIPMGINNDGQVVGWYSQKPSNSTDQTIEFFWLHMSGGFIYDSTTQQFTDFQWPDPTADGGALLGINDYGQIVGAYGYLDPENDEGIESATGFIYTPDSDSCVEDDTGAIDIMGGDACASSSETISVPVRMQNAYKPDPSNSVNAFGFEVTYDPDVLHFVNFERGDLLLGFDDVEWVIDVDHHEVATGVVRIGGFTNANQIHQDQQGILGYLVFYSQQSVSTKLDIQNMVDHIGHWSASGACLNPATGDINFDGEVTPLDALCAFQKAMLVCPTIHGPCETTPCDVDRDCLCTANDALCIFNKYIGIPSCLD